MKMQALAATMLVTMILASTASAQTFIRNSGNGTGNTINAGGGFGPTAPRHSSSYHQTRVSGGSYHQMTSFYGPATTQSCSGPVLSHDVRSNDHYPRSAVGQPIFQSSRPRTPRLSLAGLPPINVNVVKNSGNGTGNTINLPGGGGQSGLNFNLISNSANGTGNAINFGGGFPR